MRLLLPVAFCALALLGCKHPHGTIVGTWAMEEGTRYGYHIGTRFNSDGTFESWTHFPGVDGSTFGTYEQDGNQLTEWETRAEFNGKVDVTPSKPRTETVRWVPDDKLELTEVVVKNLYSTTVTFTRMKSTK